MAIPGIQKTQGEAAVDAVVLVPPFLKSAGGPLLGPALLAGAASAAGYSVRVVDFNARWLGERLGEDARGQASAFVGDHDRPAEALRSIQREWIDLCRVCFPHTEPTELGEDPYLTMTWSQTEVSAAAHRMVEGPFGVWVRAQLAAAPATSLLGISVMYSGQVLAALAMSIVAREQWPGVRIVWGGAHVTALRDAIASDPAFGEHVDLFVFGYAERTWLDLVRAVANGESLPTGAIAAGSGSTEIGSDDSSVVPVFDLGEFSGRVTLPAQSSRGCAYGRCTFCTYPAVEGAYRPLQFDPVLRTVATAQALGAAVSFKDSLLLPARLEALAGLIAGRVRWSACTKLNARFDAAFLSKLATAGCATLEVGLETLTPTGQLVIEKRQALPLFLSFLDAANSAGIAVVVNYITGFPGADPQEEEVWLAVVRAALTERAPRLVAKLEHNTFQLERMSPMGRDPGSFGLRVVTRWPWATVMGWEAEAEELRGAG